MNKLEIVIGSLQISNGGIIVLVIPKDACAIDTLALKNTTPIASVFNKYLANFTQYLTNHYQIALIQQIQFLHQARL